MKPGDRCWFSRDGIAIICTVTARVDDTRVVVETHGILGRLQRLTVDEAILHAEGIS